MENSLKILCKCGETIKELKKAVSEIDEKFDDYRIILCGEDTEFSIWADTDIGLASIESDSYIMENVVKFKSEKTEDEFMNPPEDSDGGEVEVHNKKYFSYDDIEMSNMILKVGDDCYWLEFTDVRVDRDTIPENRFMYEIAGDDDSGADPCRLAKRILVNFWGTVFSTKEITLDEDGYVWIDGVNNRLELMI